MKWTLFFSILIFSVPVFSKQNIDKTGEDLYATTKNFLTSIVRVDKILYKESVSKKFYKEQTTNGFIKKAFSKKKKKQSNPAPIDFDFKFKKGAVDKDYFFVNIKEKNEKSFSDSWFIVKKNSKGSFVIDGIHHFED